LWFYPLQAQKPPVETWNDNVYTPGNVVTSADGAIGIETTVPKAKTEVQCKPTIKSDSGMYNKIFLSADISGLFRTEIYKNFNPDARRTKAHFSLIPFYKYRNLSIGFGSFITLERYQNKFLLAYWERSIISFGPAINYTLRNTKKVPILICTRFLHNIYNEHTRFNSIPLSMKFDYRSVVFGAGPTVRFNKTQIAPTFSIITNFNDAPNNRKRIFTQSSLMINISRNIY
jgi:hypothetical protein